MASPSSTTRRAAIFTHARRRPEMRSSSTGHRMDDRERIAAVERLIVLADPLPVCRERIAGCAWDYHGVPALLTRADITRVLRRYLADELTAADVEGWADAVEFRDDIEYDAPDLDEISDLLAILSNPAINGLLTKAAARAMLG